MFRWTLHNIDTGVIQKLTKDPRGYEDLTLTHKRDEKWHGVHYDFSNEFGFFCKGAGKELLDAAYDSKGQEATVKIKLEVRCNGSWTTMLNGKLDFSTYRQEYRDNVLYTFLNAQNENIVQLIRNREDLEVDLLRTTSLDNVALLNYPYLGYDLNLHSKVVKLYSQWTPVNHGGCFRFVTNGLKELYVLPTMTLDIGDFEKSTEQCSRVEFDNVFNGFLEQASPILDTTNSAVFVQPNVVRVAWDIHGVITHTTYDVSIPTSDCDTTSCGTQAQSAKLYDTVNIKLRMYFGSDTSDISEADDCGALQTTEGCGNSTVNQQAGSNTGLRYIDLATAAQYASTSNPLSKIFTSGGAQTRDIVLNPGDRVWFYWVINMNFLSSNGDMKIEFEYVRDDFSLSSETVYTESLCNAIAIHEAWSRLSEIITDQNVAFYSEFFGRTNSNIVYPSDGCGSRVAITSGKAIRRLDTAPILESLKTMFDSCDAIWGIGLGVERYLNRWVIRVEEIDYFYSDTIVLKLDFVPNIQMKHRADLVYNEIQLGFKKWQTNAVNGLDEPLTQINYVVPPIKSNKQKFEKLSDFVAGMYAIELTRRSGDIETKDTSYDEDTFVLALRNDDLTYCEKNENMQSVTGLISPETAYNLRFLLSSTFDRLKNQFVAGLTKLGAVVMPAQGEGNQTVTYAYVPNGCAGDHFGSVQTNGRDGEYPDAQARRDNPLWVPVEYTFDYPLSFSDYLNLVANPYGLILFSNSDTGHFSGWLLSVEYNVRRKSGSFTILASSGIETPDLVMDNTLGDYYFPDYNSGDYNT